MKEGLRAHLLNDAGVAAVVGNRVSWATRPRGKPLPSIILTQISGVPDYTMAMPSGLVASRVQVDCWALTNLDATAVARAVKTALSGLRTTVPAAAIGQPGLQIQGAFLENQTDLPEDSASPPDEVLHRISLDFIIWHDE